MQRFSLLTLSLIILFALVACGSPKAASGGRNSIGQTQTKPATIKENVGNALSQTASEKKTGQTDSKPTPVSKPTSATASKSKTTVQTTATKSKTEQPQYHIDPKSYEVKPIGNANPKVVLLTIDDAPNQYALEMAKTLKSLNAYAIFFINGHFLTPEKKQWLKQITDMGFLLGNHTWNHLDLSKLSTAEQIKEIVPLNDTLKSITGESPKFFRAPFGDITPESRKLADEQKMTVMNWSYGYDWVAKYENKDALTQIMVNTIYLHNGSNILMHDHEWTSEALAGIIKGLRVKGYTIVDPRLIRTTN